MASPLATKESRPGPILERRPCCAMSKVTVMLCLGGINMYIEGSLEAKLPTIWTDGKAEVGRVREEKKEDQRRERDRRKKM